MARKTPEGKYKDHVTEILRFNFPECEILYNDSAARQGIPDILLLVGPHWAMLEVKPSADAAYQPNQEWYIEKFNQMGFSSVIHPENEAEVIDALKQAFSS